MARQRNQMTIKNFKGVDFSTPLLNVDDARAIDALNLIKKDQDRTQIRKPWEQIAAAPVFVYHKKQVVNNIESWMSYTNTSSFNGIWSFVAEDGVEHIVAHIGKCLFEVSGIGKNGDFKSVVYTPLCNVLEIGANKYNEVIELVDEKTKAVASGNRLYIMGGTKYLMVRFYIDSDTKKTNYDVCAVEDSKYVYIPVTSTGITYVDSPTPSRQLLDDVNLLSSLRKNKLISGTLFEGNNVIRTTRFYEYELDSDIDFGTLEDDSFEIKLEYRKVVD